MVGIIGRLFREFAVTVTMTIVISAIVSLTLTPMMGSRFLKPEHQSRHGRLYLVVERGFEALLGAYRSGLDVVLRHQFPTLIVFFATLLATAYLFIYIPKGFFPQQDTGLITGTSEAAQNVSSAGMARLQQALAEVVAQDPDVASFSDSIGSSGGALNSGRFFINLKPRDQRTASADEVINRLRPRLAKVEGAAPYLQTAQDI